MPNEIIKINNNTWRIEDGFVRYFLLTGTEKALLIDSGATNPDAKKIAASLTDLPIILLNTHGDGDHTAGNGAFESFYIHPADVEKCGVSAQFPSAKILPLSDGDVFDLGGRELKIISIPGHTYGSVAILDEANHALFSGDSVQSGHIFMFGANRDTADFGASLDKLDALSDKFDVIYPSHDAPELPASYVKTVKSAWDKVCAGEAEGVKENMFGNEIINYTCDGCGFYCGA